MKHPLLQLTLAVLVVVPSAVGLMWLLGGTGLMHYWPQTGIAAAVAIVAGALFYPVLHLGRTARAAGWMACIGIAAIGPTLIPPQAAALRFAAAIVSFAVILKLYDLYRSPACGLRMGFTTYLTYLPNWFWLVCRRRPVQRPVAQDVRQVAVSAPLLAAAVAGCVALFRADWSAVPFFAEHCAKVVAVCFAALHLARTAAALYRLTGASADDAFNNPFAARTPADFWRRWNRPVWQFMQEHAFKPLRGRERPIRATLAAFAVSGVAHEYVFGMGSGRVQGWQMLFFLVQGIATVVTGRMKPSGWAAPLAVVATLAFNLASSLMFFQSVDTVVPFYWRRV